MKIHEWVSETIDSHEIYDADGVRKDFREKTRKAPEWPHHTAAACRKAIADRGLGGTLEGDGIVSYGYEIAEWLAGTYTTFMPFRHLAKGRGTRFRLAHAALKRADV